MIGDILKFGGQILDKIWPNDKAKVEEAKAALLNAQMEGRLKKLQLEVQVERDLIAARSAAVVAEAQGEGWLQKNWRGVVMLMLTLYLGLIIMGWAHGEATEAEVIEIIELLKLGLSGFIFARTAEKGVKEIGKAVVRRGEHRVERERMKHA